MLGYIIKYGNLNKYSQQDWEAFNALINLFFPWTNKGGKHSGGRITTLKRKIVPIARLIQIRLLWVYNLVPEDLFDDNYVMPTNTNNKKLSEDEETKDIIFWLFANG